MEEYNLLRKSWPLRSGLGTPQGFPKELSTEASLDNKDFNSKKLSSFKRKGTGRSLYNRVSQTRDHNMSASWLARDAVHSRINMLGHTAEHLAVRLSFPAKAGIIFAGKKNHRSVTEFIISEKLWLISGCSVNHFTAETCRPSVPQQSKK